MIKIFIALLLCGLCHARTSKDLRVRIDDGRIVGRYLTSESGRTIRAFMGIPYAEPPVGDLRFRAPVQVKPWRGVLLAQQEPPMCTQGDPFARSREIRGQEDCLYLNVYTPEVIKKQKFRKPKYFHFFEHFSEEKRNRKLADDGVDPRWWLDGGSWRVFPVPTGVFA